jgi:hypothetical protein
MLSETEIEAAHPDAFDFVFGNLPSAKRAEFNRHLSSCRHCQSVVDEYADIGQIIKQLPPHVEPPVDLEDRTIAAMVEARANQRASAELQPGVEDESATQLHPRPAELSTTEPETRVFPIPEPKASAEPDTQLHPRPGAVLSTEPETTARPMVTRLPVWRRHRGRLAAVGAAAAAIIAAAVAVPLSLGGGRINPAQAVTVVTPLHVTTAAKVIGDGAATGRATARQDASGSWHISLTVAHLKSFGDSQWYQCWYVGRNGQVASAGTFQVPNGGSWTFPMTSAVDPHDFSMMEITLGPPTKTGALSGRIVLSGHTL